MSERAIAEETGPPARPGGERAVAPVGAEGQAAARRGAAAAAPEARVLALQRRAGNAAVVRWLSRQEAVDEAVPAGPQTASGRICATGSRSLASGPQRIDANDVIITPVEGPCLLDRWGGYVWTVTYRLPFPAATGGFMIQELYQQTSSGGNLHFWECWRVRGGDQEPADRADNWDDRYRNFNPNPQLMTGSSGWKRHVGVIRFNPGPLPPQFGTESPTTHFYTTQQRPDGWTGAGTRHDCYSQWDDAPGHGHFVGLVAVAGNTEWRAGAVVNDTTPRPQIGPAP